MSSFIQLTEILNNYNLIKKLYDVIRILDPDKKAVLDIECQGRELTDSQCYKFWRQNKVCENCISARALRYKDTFVKIEYNGEKVFMVTAIPVFDAGKNKVVELLKDITNTGIIENVERRSETEIYSLLNHLNEMVVKDELTQVYNRRYINERLPYDIINNNLNYIHMSLIIADIDYFKLINDRFGHLAGDFILKEFTKELQNHIRKTTDWVARYGGEEFVVCLNGADQMTAYNIAERIRQTVEAGVYKFNDHKINFTASFGICSIYRKEVSIEDLIACADKNLFRAKNAGRNRVVVADAI